MPGIFWILFCSSVLGQIDNKLTILHTNDVHSHYDITNIYGTDCTTKQIEKDECWGGLARLKRTIDGERRKRSKSLLLDGGDQFQGTLFYTYYNGNLTASVMNELGYDAMSLGNHEFDHGPQELAKAMASIKVPIVACNVDTSSLPELDRLIKPYVIFPDYGVAVVGYLTPTASSITKLGSVEVIDPVKPVQQAIDELRKKGIKRIIGLSHHGYHEDMDLASKTYGLSLIVGGHSHTYLKPKGSNHNVSGKGLNPGGFYPTPVTNLDKETTFVVQAGCWGRFLGHIDVEFNELGYIYNIQGEPIEITLQIKEDLVMKNQVAEWRAPFDDFARQVLGSIKFDLPNNKCFEKECDIGNWLADIFLNYRPQSKIAITNSAGIRAGLSAGNITVGDIQVLLPFGESLVDIELPGQAIQNILQTSLTKINPINGLKTVSSVQVSGLQITHLENKLLKVEVKDIGNKWTPINLNEIYTVTTNEFIANGGDNIIYPIPKSSPALQKVDEIVMDFIKAHSIINQLPYGPRFINQNSTHPKLYKCLKTSN